jgi:hypothetical protein
LDKPVETLLKDLAIFIIHHSSKVEVVIIPIWARSLKSMDNKDQIKCRKTFQAPTKIIITKEVATLDGAISMAITVNHTKMEEEEMEVEEIKVILIQTLNQKATNLLINFV